MTSDPFDGDRRLHAQCVRLRWLAIAWLFALSISACTSTPPAAPREYLDETTAATISVSGSAVVFALERPDLGVNARDYVTLAGIDVNTSGKHVAHVVGYAWSTLDKRADDSDAEATYELVVEDRTLPLTVLPDGFRPLGVAQSPLQPPSRSAVPLAANVSREMLALYADAPSARVVRQRAGVLERFERWSVTASR